MIFDFFIKKNLPVELPVTTDIHCHILPGVDDGSQRVDISVEIVERMSSWGIKRIFASPHVAQEMFENTPDVLDRALTALKQGLAATTVDVAVERHAEYRLDDYAIPQILSDNEVVKTMPSGYILVENSFIQEPWNLQQLVFDIKIKDMKPVLAHPERYYYYWGHNRRQYEALHEAGLLFQVNLLSLAGYYGKHEKATAEWLVNHDLVDFIGSDIHGIHHVDAVEAYLRSSVSRKHFAKLGGRLLNDTI